MTLFNFFIGISIAVIILVVYSALVVSTKQERIAQQLREENKFKRKPYSSHSVDNFAFETSEELTDKDEFDEFGEHDENFF